MLSHWFLILAVGFEILSPTSYSRPVYPTRYSSHQRYDCVNGLGVNVGRWDWAGPWSDPKKVDVQYVIEYGENKEQIMTAEARLKNNVGEITSAVKRWPNNCFMQIEKCEVTENGRCVPGTYKFWRPGTWLVVPAPINCPISTNRSQFDGGRSSEWSDQHRAKRAPANAKCFMTKTQNNKNPTSCGSGENAELISLQALVQEPGQYSEVPVDNEADLILARGDGEFHWSDLPLDKIFVCRKHLNELGYGWKKKTRYVTKNTVKVGPKCMVPEIEGAITHSKPAKADRDVYITKEESEALLIIKHVFVPLGTAACKYHKEFVGDIVAEYRVARKGYNLRDLMPRSLAESPATPRALPAFLRHQQQLTCPAFDDDVEDDPDYNPAASEPQASERMKELVLEVAKEANIDPKSIHFTGNFLKLAPATQRKRIQVAKRVTSAICGVFAPDDPQYFEKLLLGKANVEPAYADVQGKLDNIVKRTLECFWNAPTAISKQQTLSLVAPFLELSEIQAYFPDVSPYYFKRARLFAKMYNPGQTVPKPDTKRHRISTKQLEIVIQFITSPPIVMDLPFGMATVTSSAGVKEEIPRVVRLQVNERIYHQYAAFMQETNQKELAVSRSTLLRILDYCTATTRQSLQGLDYFTWAGGEGFATLMEISEKLAIYSEDRDWGDYVKEQLKKARQYLKMDYKMHIKPASRIPDHCMAYALSDPDNPSFSETLSHRLDLHCDRCESLNSVLDEIQNRIGSVQFRTDLDKHETIYEYEKAVTDIKEMKKHIMRTIRQDQARTEILEELEPDGIYVLLDWAMKMLPISGRSPQSEWFGQRGMSWHISHVTARDQTGKSYRTRIYVHAFDSVAQDSAAVIAVLHNVLEQVRKELPHVTHAYLRSDNAGCYHSAQTIAALAEVSAQSKIIIKRWDFSDPQSGKGACDRAAATIKNHVKLYAAENHKCTNVKEFAKCANSYKGIRSVTVMHVDVAVDKRKLPKIPGISRYNNFMFQNFDKPQQSDILVWQAYKIGPGLKLPRKSWRSYHLLRSMKCYGMYTEGREESNIEDDRYWKAIGEPISATGQAAHTPSCGGSGSDERNGNEQGGDEHDDDDTSSTLLFPCPTPGCIKTYQSQCALDKHIERGNHKLFPERVSLRDAAIGAYKRELEGIRVVHVLPFVDEAMEGLLKARNTTGKPSLPKGWALRTRKPCITFTQRQRSYLTTKFDSGVKTGRKLDPKIVAKQMRSDFPKEEWLTWGQIASYWSRLARTQRGETIADLDDDNDDDSAQAPDADACEADIEDDPYFNTLQDDINDGIEEHTKDIFDK